MKERFPVFDASEELEEWSDEEVERLEQEWSGRLERFTAPTPSIESTLQLIANVKRSETHQPTDHRAELESYQQAQPLVRKLFDLLAAQWNVYGSRGWIGTAVLMIGATVLSATRARSDLPMHALLEWLTYVTLITIAVVAYAFWPKNEGMSILEKLSAYTLMQQLSARFVLVVGFQMIAAVPLSWMIGGTPHRLAGCCCHGQCRCSFLERSALYSPTGCLRRRRSVSAWPCGRLRCSFTPSSNISICFPRQGSRIFFHPD
ncbi:hypothetical protein CIG75_10070 [Tumebacillus algifaecis]|uniref:Uncharacterized protein n=1 Tax=Tumebacillus algifaecis TaxID=1214604 RepID=A0A223D115_9BACL|nr:hypothetical protein [Tumebacillus algifaecis]ASS75300.1 hypothetical protein CIG75_10070 [Tumebacillus algifaecis]